MKDLLHEYMVNIITGKLHSADPDVSGMMGLDVFASGNDRDGHFWNSLIRQMLLEGLLKKDIEEYGVLKITKAGEAFMKKPKSFKIVLNNLFEEANADDEEGAEATGGAATR